MTASRSRLAKLDRIRDGAKPRVLDLFSGCGGLSLGFQTAGFEIAAGVEVSPLSAASHARNFFPHGPEECLHKHGQARDITVTEPAELAAELSLGLAADAVDVIVGGPPCQAYARVGRAKLREVSEHPEAFLTDPRHNLYLQYLKWVRELDPLAILFENVPDALNFGGHNIAEEICEVLEEVGYTAGYTLLNAANYGVPQMRERMFLVALANEIDEQVGFPRPSHCVDLPVGYKGTRSVALKTVGLSLFETRCHYIPPPQPASDLPLAATAEEAIGDLPAITLHLEGRLKRGARRFTELTPYDTNGRDLTEYARLMRTWPGFESGDGIYDHVIRYLPRDYQIFRRMRPGDQYPEAHEHALAIFREQLAKLREDSREPPEGSAEYDQLKKSIVPPYDTGKFPNKWRKLERDAPSRTLMAHLGKDGYSHIHYDSIQARTISVREAARLQSFPDGFVFEGTMNPAFSQIGNAVPPLQAVALAEYLSCTLLGADAPDPISPIHASLVEAAT